MKTPQETPPDAVQEHNPEAYPYCVPEAVWLRWLFGFITILLPVISFAINYFDPYWLKPDWQSGEPSVYVQLMFSHPVPVYFYPFLIYAMVSMGLLLSKPEKYEGRFLIRFGIFTGVVLALQYSLLVLLTEYYQIVIAATTAWIIFGFLSIWLVPVIKAKWPNGLRWIAITVGILLVIPIWPAFSLLSAGPILSLVVSSRVAVKLVKKYGFGPGSDRRGWVGVFGWVLVYAAFWRAAVVKVLELYAELPPEPWDCYIATAAARGHPGLVKSRPVELEGGGSLRVNPQLRTLKCGELALVALAPRLHQGLRGVYDRVGPSLASRMSHPLLADLAYLSLKPAEWGARIWLRILIPNIHELAGRVYAERS